MREPTGEEADYESAKQLAETYLTKYLGKLQEKKMIRIVRRW